MFSFKKPEPVHNSIKDTLHSLNNVKESSKATQVQWNRPLIPEKILDAPNIHNDYYLNLMEWSVWGQLGICLGPTVYLYTPSEITELCTLA